MSRRFDTLVIDLDGTLLGRDGGVSRRNCEAIDRARSQGYEILIATGRALIESIDAIRAIEHDGLVIAAGGSLLCDASTGCTVDRHVLAYELVTEATSFLTGHGQKVLVLKDAHRAGYDYVAVGPGDLDPASKWWFSRIAAQVRHLEDIAHDEHPEDSVRVGVVAHGETIAPIAEELHLALGDRAFLQHWAAVTETEATGSATHLLEVFHRRVNKWTMVESHCARSGRSTDRVAAIGDGLNDVELIANAGLGIAMANADERVKAVARQRTLDHDADGVAEAIDRLISGEWT